MSKTDTLNDELRVRVEKKELKRFKANAQKNAQKPYQVLLREFITAFNENRLKIIKTKDQKVNDVYITR